ncbi:hypothetical protein [Photorhabdus heterorhabditis]|nr:hypothetical protein [Photorhabdus heterorhabditis]
MVILREGVLNVLRRAGSTVRVRLKIAGQFRSGINPKFHLAINVRG